jgi:zinc transport system ATP-binding protein
VNRDEDDIIVCQKVSFGYDGHPVVRDLDFVLRRGEYLCITGENGSGKSTLVRGLLRLIPPLGGTISFSPEIGPRETGYLSQETAAKKDFPAGVYEIVLSGNVSAMGPRPFYSRREKQRALENMERLSISHLKNRCFRELSGGQQRRALLARSLCAAGKLLVLDEPFAGLDPLISGELYRLLEKINQELGITIVMVSHDIPAAKQYARRILNLGNPLISPKTEAYDDCFVS